MVWYLDGAGRHHNRKTICNSRSVERRLRNGVYLECGVKLCFSLGSEFVLPEQFETKPGKGIRPLSGAQT